MFADIERVDTERVGKNCLFDDIAQHARVRQQPGVSRDRHVTERVQAKLKRAGG
jgi:hypothetical protein